MENDYISRTQRAYDGNPDKFIAKTGGVQNIIELDMLLQLLPAHGPILDAGCAHGKDTAVFKERGYDVLGVDLSEGLLRKAHEMHPDLSFKRMDVRKLDLPDAAYAAVWSNAVLLHLTDEDVIRALREFYRVLVPRGVIAISFKEGEGSGEVLETFSADVARFYNFQTLASAELLVRAAGFELVESHVLNERERFGPHMRDLNWVWCFGRKPPATS
jgi:SAM-dependent methyltransferase